MVADTVALPRRRGPPRHPRRRALLQRLPVRPAYTARGAARLEAGADTLVLCDTNGGMLPDDSSRIVQEVAPHLTRCRSGDARAQRLGMRGRELDGRRRRRRAHVQGHQRVRRAHGQRRPHRRRRQPRAQAGPRRPRAQGPGLPEATRIAHAISEITNIAPFARQPYVGASAFAHKAGLHASPSGRPGPVPAHRPARVGNDMRMLVSEMAGRASIELKGRELGFDLVGQADAARPRHRARQERRGRGLHVRRRRRVVRAAAARRDEGRRPVLPRSRAGGCSSTAGGRGTHATAEATVKMRGRGRALVSDGRGQRPGQRARPRAAAGARARLPRDRAVRPHRLQGADHRRDPRYGRRHARAHRDHRTGGTLAHGRGGPEPHRGVVGGAHGLGGLGAAPAGRAAGWGPRPRAPVVSVRAGPRVRA